MREFSDGQEFFFMTPEEVERWLSETGFRTEDTGFFVEDEAGKKWRASVEWGAFIEGSRYRVKIAAT